MSKSITATYIFNQLADIVQHAYSGIEISDCKDLLTHIKSSSSSSVTIITDVELKDLIDNDLQTRICGEQISTTQKIQEVLEGYPALTDFFNESKVFDSLRSKFKKTIVVEKLKQNSSLLIEACRREVAVDLNTPQVKEKVEDDDNDEEEAEEDGIIWELFVDVVQTYMTIMNELRVVQ